MIRLPWPCLRSLRLCWPRCLRRRFSAVPCCRCWQPGLVPSGVLLSGLLFAMAHISVGELAPLTVLGVGLGLVRLRSGRLWPSVLMHGLWNAVTFLNLLLL